MKIELVAAEESDKEILKNLMQLYQYDFSDVEGTDVNSHGVFQYRWLDHYWTEEGRHPFLIRVDGNLAGFVLVSQHAYLAAGNAKSISEFFVMRKYRRKGVGRTVAAEVFGMFPGQWEVSETSDNKEAQAFWRAVIEAETRSNYKEVDLNDDRWKGPVQIFEIAGPPE